MKIAREYSRTRIAPTPSGFLHIGNALSFLLTARLAQQTHANVLLRIDDIDRQRVRPQYIADIFDTLQFLEISWNEGPSNAAEFDARFSQHCRLPLYQQALEQLANGQFVFACNCSRSTVQQQSRQGIYPGTCLHKQLPLTTPGVCWRLRTDTNTLLHLHQVDGTIAAMPLPGQMQYFVVKTKDGLPAYQLTSLVDDVHFGVDLVVRGHDLLPSTLAQLYLATCLQHESFLHTSFYHHPLITDTTGHKLSKSAGAGSIQQLRQQGVQLNGVLAMLQPCMPALV